jgi:hypothetical protein
MAHRGFEPPPFQGVLPITNRTTTRGELPLATSLCPFGAQSGLVKRSKAAVQITAALPDGTDEPRGSEKRGQGETDSHERDKRLFFFRRSTPRR